MYIYRIGIVLILAAVYALIWGAVGESDFMFVASIFLIVVGVVFAIGGAGVAKYDENQRHRELMEALGKTDNNEKE